MSKRQRQGSDQSRRAHRASAEVTLTHAVRRELDTLAAMVEPRRPRQYRWLDRLVQRQAEPVPRLGR